MDNQDNLLNMPLEQSSSANLQTANTGYVVQNQQLSITKSCGIFGILGKICNNKIYFCIIVLVIILAIVLYYLYFKNKKNLFPFGNVSKSLTASKNNKLSEYFVLDDKGNKVNISTLPFFEDRKQNIDPTILNQNSNTRYVSLVEPVHNDMVMLNKQMEDNKKSFIKDDENVQITENDNIAQHNLTNSELIAINNKLNDL